MKRKSSLSELAGDAHCAKAPRTASPTPDEQAPEPEKQARGPPVRTLHLSALLWEWAAGGAPHIIDGIDCHDRAPVPLARYVAGPDHAVVADGWSSEHGAFIYTPAPAGMTLRYTRRPFIGSLDDDIEALMVSDRKARTTSPLLRLHDTGETAFPETIPAPDDSWAQYGPVQRGPGPPFAFFDTDWAGSGDRDPGQIGEYALNLDWPDLPGQGRDDLEVHARYECHGWRGAWVAELLDREARGVEQDTRVEVQWFPWLWGVEVEFKPISFDWHYPDRCFNEYASDGDADDIEGLATEPNLLAYTVEATVRRILVKPGWFGMESESSEDESSKEPSAAVEKEADAEGKLDEEDQPAILLTYEF